jgi:hypothetical protein
MDNDEKRITPQLVGALGVGISVTVASAVLTTLVSPVAFPFNFLISVALGGTAGYGTLKVLDPRTPQDIIDAQTAASYQQMLTRIAELADLTNIASRSLRHIAPEVSRRLGKIALMTGKVLKRYQQGPTEYAGVTSTLLIHERFDEILAHYIKVKSGELFMDEEKVEKEIYETETYTIPMFEAGLDHLLRKLDSGEALDKRLSKDTLESMLRSLNLIESLSDPNIFYPDKETPHD